MGNDTPHGVHGQRHEHVMPFGPRLLAKGGVLFRLFAPSARTVEVCLGDGQDEQESHALRRSGAGWFEDVVPSAGPGSLYRFRIDGGLLVPDPASRAQWRDVHGPSIVVDPTDFAWQGSWRGRPWEDAVIYEIHTGTFTSAGSFAGIAERLPYLAGLGVTAIELMPVGDFPGSRNWGYDGVLPFAPDRTYGTPVDLKRLVQAAHDLEIMVLLDVVYNHFGPEGNYLHVYARAPFFTDRHRTPWGAAINFSGKGSRTVRDFFLHNALYWLEEYRFDGLRLDAAHAIFDESHPDILEEIAAAVREGPGRIRHIHLILENDNNAARYLVRNAAGEPAGFTAQWNDDQHHAFHVLLTGEGTGYYQDYADAPIRHLGRCLTEGFAYQGEASSYRGRKPRGEKSDHLPPQAFVGFLQNHDQIGNRAFGERLAALAPAPLLRLAAAVMLLAPGTPLLFMGEEFGATTPFLFFCDFGPDLRGKIAAGRLREFSAFPQFSDPAVRAAIPDPEREEAFRSSRLDWRELDSEKGAGFRELYGSLLDLRRRHIRPRLAGIRHNRAGCRILGPQALLAHWTLGDGSRLRLLANFGTDPIPLDAPLPGRPLFASPPDAWTPDTPAARPRSVVWFLEEWTAASAPAPRTGDDGQPPDALPRQWREALRPCQVFREDCKTLRVEARLPQWVLTRPLHWSVALENGGSLDGQEDLSGTPMDECGEIGGERFVAVGLTIPVRLPPGYHRLVLHAEGGDEPFDAASDLIVTPERCYVPPDLHDDGMVWGVSCEPVTLRSDRNWGVGDLSDLRRVLSWAAQNGAAAVAVSPLQPVAPFSAETDARPRYDSLTFLNPLLLGPEEIADFHESPEAAALCQEPSLKVRLAALREPAGIDFAEAARIKSAMFDICWRHFRENHLDPDSARGRSFRDFQKAGGRDLRAWAVFETLREHFAEHGQVMARSDRRDRHDRREWPEECRTAQMALDSEWARERTERIEYHEYLQWQADLQLARIGRRSMELGLKVGLWQTLPELMDRHCFEAWLQPCLAERTPENPACPLAAAALIAPGVTESTYGPFLRALRANMRHAGALAIPLSFMDGLPRPASELLGVIALESARNRCLAVCLHDRDLTDAERDAFASMSMFTSRPGHFESAPGGDWLAAGQYPAHAAVSASDVQLTPLNGFWQGRDMSACPPAAAPVPEWEDRIIARAAYRARLLVTLRRHGLLPRDCDVDPSAVPRLRPELVRAVHLFLAQTACKVFLMPLQDIPGLQRDAAETPSMPAWRHRLGASIEELERDDDLADLLRTFCAQRGRGVVRPSAPLRERSARVAVPRAFYRLQLNDGFTFRDAAGLVPYLSDLGISHCYLSPCLKARPHSPHGYDIVDHGSLNPELGSREDFEGFAAALDMHRMAQIMDVVPNHMAVGSDNAWWMDVLENGQSSEFAGYFDINWRSQHQELQGRVLLPVLGDHYGAVLEDGRLRLAFRPDEGAFEVCYYEHRFPLDPQTYPSILGHDLDRLEREVGSTHQGCLEVQNLLSSFANLPDNRERDPERCRTRRRNKEVLKRLLARLCRETPEVAAFIDDNVLRMNGEPGRPDSFELLHELLDAQPYRLAFWRVAADEINYRRFFDINELAGLRMEDPEVFAQTHRLVLDLVATGKVDGLRIDHPDGLYDPLLYFRRLQQAIGRDDDSGQLPLYVVAEKILADYEHLPRDWPVHGTTGYDFGAAVTGLFVDPDAKRDMTRVYHRFIGRVIDFDDLLYESKKRIITTAMAGELNVLAEELSRLAKADRHTRDFTLNGLRGALVEFVANFPVYRTYIRESGPARHERNYIEWAVARAGTGQGAHAAALLDFLRAVLLQQAELPSGVRDAAPDFVMKVQQYTGPVMAKGMEDTSFYIANRLLSLNEVGADPRRFGVSLAAFHNANRERAGHHPHAMLNTSTHDSKRSGDVRSRISVLSEMPAQWEAALRRWRAWNRRWRRRVGESPAPSRNDEYALYQNLLGVWPLEAMDGEALALFAERVGQYMVKAAREAKARTSWVNPNRDYEEALLGFVRGILLGEDSFVKDFDAFQAGVARFGMYNSLSQLLLKLTSPGIPDIYQGSELWRLSLVDPDNRRPVDFERRRAALAALRGFMDVPPAELPLRARQLLDTMPDGRIKLYTLWRTLGLRRERPELFEHGAYQPLTAEGEKEKHVCAFLRQTGADRILVAVPRLVAGLLHHDCGRLPLGSETWGETVLPLPANLPQTPWRNVFTGAAVPPEAWNRERLKVRDCFTDYPVCLLVQSQEKGGTP